MIESCRRHHTAHAMNGLVYFCYLLWLVHHWYITKERLRLQEHALNPA